MARIASLGIAACMAVIAASVSVVLALGFGLSALASALAGFGVFLVLAFAHLAAGAQGMISGTDRIDEVERGMGETLDRLDGLDARMRDIEASAGQRVRAATAPLAAELATLSGLIKQVADEVAAHETLLNEPRRPAPAIASAPPPSVTIRPPPPPPQPPVRLAPALRASSLPLAPSLTPAAPLPSPPTPTPPRAAPAQPAPPVSPVPPTPLPPQLPEEVVPAAKPPEEASPSRPAPQRPSIFQIPPDLRGKPIPPPLAMPPPPPRRPTPMTRQPNAPDAAELERLTRVREALHADRHEVLLRTIVRLPSRRVSHYEAISRLREEGGDALPNADHLSAAERGGLMPDIDRLVFTAISGMARKLAAGNRTAGVVFNLAPATLIDGKLVADLFRLADEDAAIAEHLVLQMPQLAWTALSSSEADKVASLVEKGYRVSLDRLGHMRLDGRELARRGVRYVKLQASLLLDPKAAAASPIHPADLAGLLERNGVTLIVDDVDQEALVPELLDVGVKFAQGPVFGEARPIRPDGSPEPPRKGSGGRAGAGD